MNQQKTTFEKEIRVIPAWAYVVATMVLTGIVVLMEIMFRHDTNSPPFPVQLLISVLAGCIAAFFVLLIGYVNGDARRRNMSALLWTLLVIFIPNAIGFILYFVLRKPISVKCPQCGQLANPEFNFCPACKYNLRPTCPHCQHAMNPGDKFCPYCSHELTPAGAQAGS